MGKFSVVTIVKGRRKQLANLLESISLSTILPQDVQIICMDSAKGILPPATLHVEIHELDDGADLPLAAARNKGMAMAHTDTLVFIDVDCIASPTLFEEMLKAVTRQRVVAAFPLYLPFVPESGKYAAVKGRAITHPARASIVVGRPAPHLQFWSLIFAINKSTFQYLGGFDESFTGYGAEDTDFAMSFHKAGIEQIFILDYVLHQYHDKYDPPLNHFDEIIQNAKKYQVKWGVLPMKSWLNAFSDMGLISIDDSDSIKIISYPTTTQIQNCISKNPY